MTDERRRKTAAERAIDRKAVAHAQTKLNAAVGSFFSNVCDYGGTYGDVGMRHYDRMRDAHGRLTGPLTRVKETHVAGDVFNLPEDQKKTTSNLYFYDSVHSTVE